MSVWQDQLRLGPEFFQDPHGLYAESREHAPVRPVVMPQGLRGWLVTGYDEARTALTDPTVSKDFEGSRDLVQRHREPDRPQMDFGAELAAHMLNSDPPDHTRLRKMVNRAFTVRGIGHLRPRVEEITEGLLDAMAGSTEVDLLSALAFPLPITVICELLGVPLDDRDAFREWTGTVISTEPPAVIQVAAAALVDYMGRLVAMKRENPGEDLLTALLQTAEDGDRLTEVELLSMVFLLLIAGHETTVNLIGNAVLALLRNPDQLAALRADPTLLPGAVEEFLRFESPVGLATLRYTTAPLRLGAVEVPAGEFLVVSLGAANRDEAQFPAADRLDITRRQGGHLAFGHGIHYCVGAPLARMEGEIALGALLRRFPALSLAVDPSELRWRESTIVRGLHSLPVRLV